MSDELPKVKLPKSLAKEYPTIALISDLPVGIIETEITYDELTGEPDYIFVKPKSVVKKPPKKGEVKKEIWKVTSFYLSEGQTWPQIVADAKEVAQVSNQDRTITVAHKHFLGQNCTKACKAY